MKTQNFFDGINDYIPTGLIIAFIVGLCTLMGYLIGDHMWVIYLMDAFCYYFFWKLIKNAKERHSKRNLRLTTTITILSILILAGSIGVRGALINVILFPLGGMIILAAYGILKLEKERKKKEKEWERMMLYTLRLSDCQRAIFLFVFFTSLHRSNSPWHWLRAGQDWRLVLKLMLIRPLPFLLCRHWLA